MRGNGFPGAFRLLFIFSLLIFSPLVFASPLSRLLGFGPEDRVLIVHADDLGLLPSVNRVSVDAMRNGIVSSGSVMMPAPAAQNAIRDYMRDSQLDLGLHLTLNSEWKFFRWGPVSPPDAVRSLLDSDSWLYPGHFRLFSYAWDRDVERELEGQIQAALHSGMKPSHIDSHMGSVFIWGPWFKSYLKLAKQYRLPPMFPRSSEDLVRRPDWLKFITLRLIQPMLHAAELRGFLPLDSLVIDVDGESYDQRKRSYIEALKNLRPGVTQIIVHLADEDREFRDTVIRSDPSQMSRIHDWRILQDPEIRQVIEEQNIRLVSWKQIQEKYPWDRVR